MSLTLNLCTLGNNSAILREDLSRLVSDPKSLTGVKAEMMRICRTRKGIGLAANQVRLRENLFLIMPIAGSPFTAAELCINPTWERADGAALMKDTEGCLSLPGKKYRVERWTSVRASWTNTQGHRREHVLLKGYAARTYQHEMSHLQGNLISDMGEETK